MRANKIISHIMKEQKFTQARMALAIGKKTPNEVSAGLCSKNMTFEKANEMLSVLGYEIVIQPKSEEKHKEGTYVVSEADEEDGENEENMNSTEALKEIMRESNITQTALAEKIGANRQSNVGMYLNSGNGMKVENLIRMANALGYDVVLKRGNDEKIISQD